MSLNAGNRLSFAGWYYSSKYAQVVYDSGAVRQIALDAWEARQPDINILTDMNIQCNLDLIRISKRLEEAERQLTELRNAGISDHA